MTSSSARLAILAAILFLGCADDTTRLAGGTGSDLPRPLARLFDTSMQTVPAKAYRLWKVENDSLVPSYQAMDTGGFQLPESGTWVVEAWSDTDGLGSVAGLAAQRRIKVATCPTGVGRSIWDGGRLGVIECRELLDSSNQKKMLSLVRLATPRPVAVGTFQITDTIHRFMRVPDGVAASQFLFWKIQTDSIKGPDLSLETNEKDSLKLRFFRYGVSAQRGVVDVTLPQGDWLIEAWNYSIDSKNFRDWLALPHVKYGGLAELTACKESPQDCGRPSKGPFAQGINAPDKIFYFVSP
jgi:hypothetical protein